MNINTNLIKLLQNAGYEPRHFGRGMYGSKCVGVTTVDSSEKVVLTVIEEALDGFEEREAKDDGDKCVEEVRELIKALKKTKSVSMGRSSIIYWPEIEWTEECDVETYGHVDDDEG